MSDAVATDAAVAGPEAERLQEKAFGFWLYLMTDAIIFALLFATYIVMLPGTAGGPSGHDVFSLPHTFGETLLLLFSSTTFGFAWLAAQGGDRRSAVLWLLVTALLGVGFVAMEIIEFAGMIAAGAGPTRSGYLSAFFTLVGTHGVHVSMGLLCIAAMVGQIMARGLTPPVLSRLYRLALFWHFLDIVWIGIFSIVYLPGVLG